MRYVLLEDVRTSSTDGLLDFNNNREPLVRCESVVIYDPKWGRVLVESCLILQLFL